MNTNGNSSPGGIASYRIRLFISGDAPNSRIAQENLRRMEAQLDGCRFDVEIVDVMIDPQTALAHSVFLTPALQIVDPGPGTIIFGNLSDMNALQSLFSGAA